MGGPRRVFTPEVRRSVGTIDRAEAAVAGAGLSRGAGGQEGRAALPRRVVVTPSGRGGLHRDPLTFLIPGFGGGNAPERPSAPARGDRDGEKEPPRLPCEGRREG